MKTKKIFRAGLTTNSFHFEAYGETWKEAKQTLRRTWLRHCKEYGEGRRSMYTWPEVQRQYGIDFIEVECGSGYRDGEEL